MNIQLLLASKTGHVSEALSRHKIDLLLCPHSIPRIGGLEFINLIHQKSPATQIFVLLEPTEEVFRKKYMEGGASDCLPCPMQDPGLSRLHRAVGPLIESPDCSVTSGTEANPSPKELKTPPGMIPSGLKKCINQVREIRLELTETGAFRLLKEEATS